MRLVTWNILADSYAKAVRKNDAKTDEFEQIIKWSNRFSHISLCIQQTDADVICLQEVDHFEDSFVPLCASIGFGSVYVQRPQKDDGCLIMYRLDKYKLLSARNIHLDDVADLYKFSLFNNNNKSKYTKQNVAVIAQFQFLSSSLLFNVCTCHLHWNPNLLDVKLAQAKYILKHLYQFRVTQDSSHQHSSTIPTLFTGDFNSLPHDLIYNTITSSYSSCEAIDNVALDFGSDVSGAAAVEGATGVGGGSGSMSAAVVRAQDSDYFVGGAKTRFLCDTTMYKLGKWMRVLGINVAIDGWDSPDRTVRTGQIEAFFGRARREKRVILTTSKTLRERASCPHSVLIDHSDLKQALVSLFIGYQLPLNIMNFLTVCIKCGDEIEPVTRDDPNLASCKHIPSDRQIFACISCYQPYWWSEEHNSSPAKALRKAEELYNLVLEGLRAADCAVSRQILANMQTTDCRDIVTGRRVDILESGQLQNHTPYTSFPSADQYCALEEEPLEAEDISLAGLTVDDSQHGDSSEGTDSAPGPSLQTAEFSPLLFPDTPDTPSTPSSTPADSAAEGVTTGHELKMTSVFERLGRPEPLLTNWNGEFKATLDYVFATEEWAVHSAVVCPSVSTHSGNALSSNIESSPLLLDIAVDGAQPSAQWPSDHFLILTELTLLPEAPR